MRKGLGRVAGWLIVLVGAAGLASCDDAGGDAAQNAAAGMPPPVVSAQVVSLRDVPIVQEYAGRTQGAREVQVRARVTGILLERTFEEGQTVAEGDLLFRIDPQPFEVKLQAAEARLQQARASLTQAERNWARVADLWKSRTISARSRDDAQAELDLARAALAGAEAEVEAVRIDLGYTDVRAPVSGVTSLEVLPEGSLVGNAPDNSLLTTITQLEPIHVVFAFPEAEQMRFRTLMDDGQVSLTDGDGPLPVAVVTGDGIVHPHLGRVDFTASGVDPRTGTIQARAIIPNPDHRLLPGQFVRIQIKGLVRHQVAVVPDKALMQGPQGQFVYVVDAEGKAQVRPVVTDGLVDEGRIVEAGLKDGDRVITEGVIKVRPGSPVQVKDAAPAAPVAAATASGEAE